MQNLNLNASYYQQFDADFSRDVPAEGYGGWRQEVLPIPLEKTALVVMHAWDTGTCEEYPGWHRAVEYIPRADAICREIFPPLLRAVRDAKMNLFHVVGGGKYYERYAGYQRAKDLAGVPPPSPQRIRADDSQNALQAFRASHVFVGEHNAADVQAGFAALDFPEETRPVGNEGVAENAHQLFALCEEAGVNHLIYVGFAINWCLLLSPGGMWEMSQRGFLCSTIRQATTAVENRETARTETAKEIALWRVALAFGFVFDLDDVLGQLRKI
jgi:hypothetical protein